MELTHRCLQNEKYNQFFLKKNSEFLISNLKNLKFLFLICFIFFNLQSLDYQDHVQ